jgi:hypothetical protein
MGRKRKRNNIPGGFVAMPRTVLKSKAYIKLKPSSAKALPYFMDKKWRSERGKKSYFVFPYTEAEDFGFAPSTFHNVIKDLIRVGFVDPVDKGGLRSDGKSYNQYTLSYRWKKYGETDFETIEWDQFIPKN